ncbi:bifunctional phosphopantothenoylcysteine decarboxylase/phosphopantothenate--cysteine ligase CoaBC [Vallitalea pronyensis]|uniref:Coenzyme A biosynthesis bifunctional protein CoaBC n=1 Tax=Vallitalea pronyensis TaxID=1348613 RepID=A0A8J8SFL8_9FIRM|nr:bifunctional phosphopantothenoylcysteine decarboxylase/phosphopantothenate--cysteine ligase CoaBC [Vallitalea pronyensis]QUI21820.1 bifunctional phosphopantothenoylcysteine decarboxylase/phosphopantothenate--cysteine ligase CoaBC [Vallitalea pronyensis]
MLKGKTIVIGVSGGIAVYKVCDIVSQLKKLNATVHVIMTKSATEFVAPLTFRSLSQQPVVVDMFEKVEKWDIEHIALAKAADLFLLAPATANMIGKMANGIADDMLSTTVMATKAPVFIAPAMNANMYDNPIVQRNIKRLKAYGYAFIDPDSGRLACGDIGQGKLAHVGRIMETIKMQLVKDKIMTGQKVLITAGPTREAIDPVRYLTNHSSGKMGYALAKAAIQRGADVTLITGPVHLEEPKGLATFIQVETAEDMFQAVKAHVDHQDIIIKSAAVADYRPAIYHQQKMKKSDEDLVLTLNRNPDILKWIGMHKKPHQFIVGFAAETNDIMENGVSKLKAKGTDLMIINDITRSDAGFQSDTNQVILVSKKGEQQQLPVMPKSQLAHIILDNIIA